MNILVPVSWLTEYIETEMTPEELAALGSLHGPSFERIETIEGEPVYDIEITTNRVDAMSIRGLARELAAIGGDKVTPKKLVEKKKFDWALQTEELKLPKIEVQTDTVKKIVCVVLDNVNNCNSPDWLAKRLRQIGQNPHGIIIDMSNYVTHELGHPCHTFDYDKIMKLGGKIVIKQAEAGKKFVTLDGEEHETKGGEIVYENGKGEIIDFPAIKGTANTAISGATRRVLFWLENMDAPTVRQASMSHAIRTVAAILNEKNVDPALMEEVLVLGTEILQENAGAKIASPVYTYTDETLKKTIPAIKFNLDRLDAYLGVKIEEERIKRILSDLGFKVKTDKERVWSVTPPSFRAHDVTMEADLIEEVARLYGYHLLPSNIDFQTVQISRQQQFDFALENRLKHALVDMGLTEVYTYSMISEGQVKGDAKKWLRLINPLTEDKVYLRQSLIPSLRQVYQENQVDKNEIAGIFELANVYFPGRTKDKVDERLNLGVLTTLPYREARGILERALKVNDFVINIDKSGKITVDNDEIGWTYVLDDGKIAIEIEMQALVAAKKPRLIKTVSTESPSVHEDLTFVVPLGQPVGEILDKIRGVSPLIAEVKLGEIYQDHETFHLKYQKPGATLTSEELRPVRLAIVVALKELKCELVGRLEG